MRVLITGAAGRIGGYLRSRLARPDRVLRLLDIVPLTAGPGEEVVQGSVDDVDVLIEASRDVDAVIHLAGIPSETEWDRILTTNIDGTYHAIEAARRAGVRRFVFASSNHAVGFLARDADGGKAPDYAFPAPDTYYGVSKVAGEALSALYHHRYGMDAVCLRILSCLDRPESTRQLATWLSPDDAGRLFEAALSTPSPGFRVVWGVSANTRSWFSMDEATALGYHPKDDAEAYADELVAGHGEPDPDDPVQRLVGGPFTLGTFDADHLTAR
ncbi:MAG: NAD(P)-dependent oxidoreductase [Acidimicrobiales bacterium]|nr:NAD(P)-dependent oxidoreductase [Acidimicrobiales bacterium]